MKSMNTKNIWEDITSEEEKLEMDYLEKTLLGNIDKIIDDAIENTLNMMSVEF